MSFFCFHALKKNNVKDKNWMNVQQTDMPFLD
jgi:hypothetical protein